MTEVVLDLAIGLAAAFGALGTGVFLYVAVSFLASSRHTPARGAGEAMRQIVRETWLALVVTPLLLPYFVFGRRMARGSATPIVLVHGYTQNRGTFFGLSRALRRAGLGPVYGFNYCSFQSVRRSAASLARFVRRVLRETGAGEVDLVAHSMGGLVSLEVVRAMQRRVRRVVTIASPHRGVLWKGPVLGAGGNELKKGSTFLVEREGRVIDVPILSIASTHDNIVHPAAQSALAHARNFVVDGPGHLAILYHDGVAREVVEFLSRC